MNILNKMHSYENLDAVKCCRVLIVDIYRLTRTFPIFEKFGLSSQMQRSAISILSNLVEGLSRSSHKEKLRFLEISYGSLLELDVQVIISLDLNFIDHDKCVEMRKSILRIVQILSGIKRSLSKNQ